MHQLGVQLVRLSRAATTAGRCAWTRQVLICRPVYARTPAHESALPSACSGCTHQPARPYHLTTICTAGKAKNTKRKLVKPVHFKPKGMQEVVGVWHHMTVRQLATTLHKDVEHVFEVMLYIKNTDHYEDPDSVIDNFAVIKEIVKKSGFKFRLEEIKNKVEKENKDVFRRPPAAAASLRRCPPVVTIMGHVDHGKTTLLDSLRHSNVVAHEFGGITQHIGAFSVCLPSGETIMFLDTPGHAAFSAMRARGAHVTDIVVLVVAADDGVMRQTQESVKLAQQEKVPMIVAINKIDKPQANVEATKQGLLSLGLLLEEQGGDVQTVPVSALKGTNLAALQEAIVALAEVLEVSADPTGMVEGAVIESRTDTGRGRLSTALIQRGTLRKGSVIVAGTAWAKVRGMFNDKGQPVVEAGPGQAVEVIGWRDLPSAGDEIIQVESESRAHEVMRWRQELQKSRRMTEDEAAIQAKIADHQRDYDVRRHASLEAGHRRNALYRKERIKETIITHTGPELAIVVKGDVDGSVEAILNVLDSYTSDQCRLHLLNYGVGPINEHDLDMAYTFNGIVYAFNTGMSASVGKVAASRRVPVHHHNVIYKMMDDLREQLTDRLPAKEQEVIIGEANVQQVFMVTDNKRKIPVAGCRCSKGLLNRKKRFKLLRGDQLLIDGTISSLRHFKSEVDSIKFDVECGLSFGTNSVVPEQGDLVVCYDLEEVKQEIDWELDF